MSGLFETLPTWSSRMRRPRSGSALTPHQGQHEGRNGRQIRRCPPARWPRDLYHESSHSRGATHAPNPHRDQKGTHHSLVTAKLSRRCAAFVHLRQTAPCPFPYFKSRPMRRGGAHHRPVGAHPRSPRTPAQLPRSQDRSAPGRAGKAGRGRCARP